MNFIYTILWPLEWVVELILIGWHWLLTELGMSPVSGLTWVLAIVGLTIVIRAAIVPIFVRQIKNQRRMLEIAPKLKKIQDKYKGKKDQLSRESMTRETMALYKETGTNPLSSCLPVLLQMPIFFSLYHVVLSAAQNHDTVGLLDHFGLATSFANAKIFGAPLADSFGSQWGPMVAGQPYHPEVMVTAGIMVILMIVSQFITQLQIISKNISEEAKDSQQFKMQRKMMYFLPFIFLFSGVAFPLAPMFYWVTSNVWTMVQQYVVIRNMPTPGSQAAKDRQARLVRRGKFVEDDDDVIVIPPARKTQRSQPIGKSRAKKRATRPSSEDA
jgi:YidC/Oxa1 family membrane protein insertase